MWDKESDIDIRDSVTEIKQYLLDLETYLHSLFDKENQTVDWLQFWISQLLSPFELDWKPFQDPNGQTHDHWYISPPIT